MKRWAAWPQGPRWLTGGIAAVVLAMVIVWALLVPAADWLAHHDVGSVTGPLRTLRLQTARDAARGRLLTLGAGLLALSALIFTALNFNLLRRNSEQADQWQRRSHELTEHGQVTDRYTKAIEQLGSDKLDVRIGGIYALERIARDSATDHPTVMEVLSAFIREHSREQWPPPPTDEPGSDAPTHMTRPDVQAALTVIARRDIQRDRQPIDLTEADLAHANLGGATLVGAVLSRVNLHGATLFRANLVDGYLNEAALTDANLFHANLTRAILFRANLIGAYLTNAGLTDANLNGANLTRADLSDAKLTGANLTRANLTGANLTGAKLSRANLADALWPQDVVVPEGWQRDTGSGRLRRADADSGE
jgi:Pentapeptide repeats (8 copies)